MVRSAFTTGLLLLLLPLQVSVWALEEECNADDGTSCREPKATLGSVMMQVTSRHQSSGAGSPDCPCLTPEQTDLMKGTFPERIYTKNVNGEPHNFLPDCKNKSKEWYFPALMGVSECTTFAGVAPFCGDGTAESPRAWTDSWMCETPWCLVDAENCKADWFIPGNLFPGLSFSYMTCAGNADAAAKEKIEAITKALKENHRAYHCAGGEVSDQMQKKADEIENGGD